LQVKVNKGRAAPCSLEGNELALRGRKGISRIIGHTGSYPLTDSRDWHGCATDMWHGCSFDWDGLLMHAEGAAERLSLSEASAGIRSR